MTTIKEIALKTNFSSTTISRVLNNDQSLSVAADTREKIMQAANELGYKTLQERKKQQHIPAQDASEKIGVLLCHSVEEEMNDPYFLSIRQGIEEECRKRDFITTELFRLTNLRNGQIDKEIKNLVVLGRIGSETLHQISDQLENVVYINHTVEEEQYDSVIFDFEKATKKALDHLLDLGYEKIGFIGGEETEHFRNEQKEFEDERRVTFKTYMEEKGVFDSSSCYVGEFTMASAYNLMKKAIQKGDLPEAFFIASDSMAIGALRALQESNYKVPEDVAIVGFNDVQLAQFASTPLTTVRVHTEEMGRMGVKLMEDRINGRQIPVKVTLPTELVVRDSCGAKVASVQ